MPTAHHTNRLFPTSPNAPEEVIMLGGRGCHWLSSKKARGTCGGATPWLQETSPGPKPPLRWLTPLAHRTSVHRSGSARWFRPYPPQTPTQRPPVRVLPLPILTTTAYLGSKLRFPPTSFTSSYVLGRTRQPSVTCNPHSMEAGREQRMIEIDRAPGRVCSKVRGLPLATSCHRARLYQVRGRPRGHEMD